MKVYVIRTAKVYDENQEPIPAQKLDWRIVEGLEFNNYDEANIRRISMQATNSQEYISIKEINK